MNILSVLNKFLLWNRDNLRRNTRFSVILGVFAISGFLLPHFSQRWLLYTIGLLLALAISIIFLHWPIVGLAFLIFGSTMIPFAIQVSAGTELNITVLLIGFLCGLWILDMVVRSKQIRLISSRPLLPLFCFILIAALAFAFGQLPWLPYAQKAPFPAQLAGLAIFILSAAVFLLSGHQIHDLRSLKVIVWVYLACGSFYVSGRLIPTWGNIIFSFIPRGSAGGLLWTWLASIALSQALVNIELKPFVKIVLGAFVAIILFLNVYGQQAYISGWMPMLVGILTVIFLGKPRLFAGLLPAGASIAALQWSSVKAVLMAGDNPYSLETRLAAWRILGEIIRINPIIGLGPANYYAYTAFFPILGYYVRFNSHNNYMDIIAQTGFLGLFFFLWFAWEVGSLGWRLLGRVPGGFGRAYVVGAVGGLVGSLTAAMLGDWLLPFVYNTGLPYMRSSALAFLFLGVLVALDHMYPLEKAEVV